VEQDLVVAPGTLAAFNDCPRVWFRVSGHHRRR
jgi:hypothetical protein